MTGQDRGRHSQNILTVVSIYRVLSTPYSVHIIHTTVHIMKGMQPQTDQSNRRRISGWMDACMGAHSLIFR